MVSPAGPGCDGDPTAPLAVALNCPTADLTGAQTLCVGETSTAPQISFGGAGPWTVSYEIEAPDGTITSFTGVPVSVNPFTVDVATSQVGTYEVRLTGVSASGCSGSAQGVATVEATAAAPAQPLDATICEGEQPFDLTALEDPAYPGGTWSGPVGVAGSTFDIGRGAAGTYTVTYTPPAGSACAAPGDATVTVQAAGTVPLSSVASAPFCAGDPFFAVILLGDPTIAGTFVSPYYNPTSGLIALPAGASGPITVEFVPDDVCLAPALITLDVSAAQPAQPTDATACENEQPIDLTPLADPAFPGGTWSGPQVTGSTFDAGPGGAGVYVVTYTPPPGSGCATAGDATVTIEAAAQVFASLVPQQCSGASPLDLNAYVSPAVAGTWAGSPYVTVGGALDPPPTFTGTVLVEFTPAGCYLPVTVTVDYGAGAEAQPLDATLCVGELPYDLTQLDDPALPGGAWSGPGVVGGQSFEPTAGPGTYVVTYTPPPGSACVAAGQATLTLQAQTTYPQVRADVCPGDVVDLLTLLPPGVGAGGSFPPGHPWQTGPTTLTVPLSAGGQTANWPYTSPDPCDALVDLVLDVGTPVILQIAAPTVCEADQPYDLTQLEPAGYTGGVWSGPGVVGGSFDVGIGAGGTYALTYAPPSAPGACAAEVAVTIDLTPAGLLTVTQVPDQCAGASVDLSAFVAPAVSGEWGNSPFVSRAGILAPDPAFTGTVIATFAPDGCYAPVDVAVEYIAPTATSPLDVTVCETDVSEDLTPYGDPAYPGGTWSGYNVVSGSTLAGPHAPGTYTLTYSPPSGAACASDGTAVLTVESASPVPLSAAQDQVCAGATFELSAYVLNGLSATFAGDYISAGGTVTLPVGFAGTLTYTFGVAAGCYTPSTLELTVVPSATLQPRDANLCTGDGVVDLSAYADPAYPNERWSGPFVAAGQFDASAAGPGTYLLTYEAAASGATCLSPGSAAFTVDETIEGAPLDGEACAFDQPVDLTTLEPAGQAGGIWSGAFVSGSEFDAGPTADGVYIVTYTPPDPTGAGCVSSGDATVTIRPAVFADLQTGTACPDSGPYDLSALLTGTPPAGSWSGDFVAGGTFDTDGRAPGDYAVGYFPDDPCGASTQTIITVGAGASPTLAPGTACLGAAPLDLATLADPNYPGGTWTGPGVSGTTFDASALGVGTYTLTYTPAAGGCASAATTEVTVVNGGTLALGAASLCEDDNLYDLSVLADASYPQGTWSGPGVTAGGRFDPGAVGPGTYAVTFAPAAPCVAPASTQVEVRARTRPSLVTAFTVCQGAPDLSLDLEFTNTPIPAGTWSGAGVVGSQWTNSSLAPGVYTLTFTPAPGQCLSVATVEATIEASPQVALVQGAQLCRVADPLDLASLVDPDYPTGTWTLSGVAVTQLDPSALPIGPVELAFTPDQVCVLPGTTTVEIVDEVAYTLTPLTLCTEDGPVVLATLNPVGLGGSWTIDGVPAVALDPGVPGTYDLRFAPAAGACAQPQTTTATVTTPGQPQLRDATVCAAVTDLDLAALADPDYPGTWSGPGVDASGLRFDATAVGTGVFVLDFDPEGACVDPAQATITVSAQTTVSLQPTVGCAADLLDLATLSVDGTLPAGSWTADGSAVVSPLDLSALGAGTYTLTFTPDDLNCGVATQTTLTVEAVGTLTFATGPFCVDGAQALDLAPLIAPAGIAGAWSGGGVTADGVVAVPDVDAPAQYVFTPGAGCFDAAGYTFDVVAVAPLTAADPVYECAGDAATYTATIELGFAGNNGAVAADLGTIAGTTLTVDGLASGSANSVTITDAVACTPDLVVPVGFTCPQLNCTTDAGTLSGGPFELCEGETLVPNASVGFFLDADDALAYVIDDDEDPTNGILEQAASSAFERGARDFDVVYYVYAVAGDEVGSGGAVDLADECLDASSAVRVRWSGTPAVTVTAENCDATAGTVTYELTLGDAGRAPFTASGVGGAFDASGRVFTTDPVAQGTEIRVSFTSAIGCETPLFAARDACEANCDEPDPGSFASAPTQLCGDFVSDAGYNDDAVLAPGDVRVFVIYAEAVGGPELGREPALPIDFGQYATTGQTVYVSSLAGGDDGAGGIDPDCRAESSRHPVTLVAQPTTTIDTVVCPGGSVTIAGELFDETRTTGTVTLPGEGAACDTLADVTLGFSTGEIVQRFELLCSNESATVGGRVFNADNPSDTFFIGENGCQTRYEVEFFILEVGFAERRDILCAGEELTLGGTTFSAQNPSGQVVLVAENGCDSIVDVDLTFLPRASFVLRGPDALCNPGSIPVEVEVFGTRPVEVDEFLNGTNRGRRTLQPGVNLIDYPASTVFSLTLANARALGGGCTEVGGGDLRYAPRISLIDPSIPTPLSGDFAVCGDVAVESINVVPGPGQPPYSYLWSTGDTTVAIEGVGVGRYTVAVTDELGCEGVAEVDVVPGDTVGYVRSVIDPSCPGGTGSISVSLDETRPGLLYRFDLPGLEPVTATDFVFDGLEEGTYVFQLIQTNGCEQDELIRLDAPPQINLIKRDTVEIELGDSVRLVAEAVAGDVDLRWTPPDFLDCDTCARPMASPPFDVTYGVSLTSGEGCALADEIFVRVLPTRGVFIPTAFSPNADAVNDVFVPEAGAEVEVFERFLVFDRWGNLVHSAVGFAPGDRRAGWDGTYRGEPMDPAVFVAMVEVRFVDGVVRTFTGDVSLIR